MKDTKLESFIAILEAVDKREKTKEPSRDTLCRVLVNPRGNGLAVCGPTGIDLKGCAGCPLQTEFTQIELIEELKNLVSINKMLVLITK